MTARLGTGRVMVVFLAFALIIALVRPAPARAAEGDTTKVRLGEIKALFGPNLQGSDTFDVDRFHALSATAIFNDLTFESSFPEAVFNPPAGTGPKCSNNTGVDENTVPLTAIARQPDGSCRTIPAVGTSPSGRQLQAGVDQLTAFLATFVSTVDVDRPGVATFDVQSSSAWFMGMSPPPLSVGSNPPVEFLDGTNVAVPGTTAGGLPSVGGKNVNAFANRPLKLRFPVAGTYTMEIDFAHSGHAQPSFVLKTGSAAPSATTGAAKATTVQKLNVIDSVRSPSDISNSVKHVATNVALAAGLGFAVAFPSELFDSTFAEHYDEITGWFRRQRDRFRRRDRTGDQRRANRLPSTAVFAIVLLVTGLLYGLLDPNFGFDRDSAVLFVGLLVALVASTVVFSLPAVVMMRVRHGEWGRPSALPGALPVAAACVLLSRIAHFQPGYLYGAILGFGFAAELSKDEEGQTVAITVLWTLVISVVAWIMRTPVHTAAIKPGASFGVQMLDTALASIVVIGIEGAVIGLLPLQFLDGARLKRWNRRIWLAIFAVALFAFVDILLNPASGYISSTSRGAVVTTAAVFVGFGLGSIAFWAYFRYRPAPRTTSRV